MNDDKFQGRYHIDSARLADYDYGSNGMYFITICTKNRESYFGEIIADDENHCELMTTPIGQRVIDGW
jgi:putative transposase